MNVTIEITITRFGRHLESQEGGYEERDSRKNGAG